MLITCSTTCSTSSCLKNKPHIASAVPERRGPVPWARGAPSPSKRVAEPQPAAQQHQREAAAASRRRPRSRTNRRTRVWKKDLASHFTSLSPSPVLAFFCPRRALWWRGAAKAIAPTQDRSQEGARNYFKVFQRLTQNMGATANQELRSPRTKKPKSCTPQSTPIRRTSDCPDHQ